MVFYFSPLIMSITSMKLLPDRNIWLLRNIGEKDGGERIQLQRNSAEVQRATATQACKGMCWIWTVCRWLWNDSPEDKCLDSNQQGACSKIPVSFVWQAEALHSYPNCGQKATLLFLIIVTIPMDARFKSIYPSARCIPLLISCDLIYLLGRICQPYSSFAASSRELKRILETIWMCRMKTFDNKDELDRHRPKWNARTG